MLRLYLLIYLNFVYLLSSLAYFFPFLKSIHRNNARKLNHNNYNLFISQLYAKSKKKDNAAGSWDWINSNSNSNKRNNSSKTKYIPKSITNNPSSSSSSQLNHNWYNNANFFTGSGSGTENENNKVQGYNDNNSDSPPAMRYVKDYQVGEKLRGKVTAVKEFGLFVDVGAEREGLVHIKDISSERSVENIQAKIIIGQDIDVWVKFVDEGSDPTKPSCKLGLQMYPFQHKQVLIPLSELESRQGLVGTIIKESAYGLFIDVGTEVDGFLRRKLMKRARGLSTLKFEVGSQIKVWVVTVDQIRRFVTLTTFPPEVWKERNIREVLPVVRSPKTDEGSRISTRSGIGVGVGVGVDLTRVGLPEKEVQRQGVGGREYINKQQEVQIPTTTIGSISSSHTVLKSQVADTAAKYDMKTDMTTTLVVDVEDEEDEDDYEFRDLGEGLDLEDEDEDEGDEEDRAFDTKELSAIKEDDEEDKVEREGGEKSAIKDHFEKRSKSKELFKFVYASVPRHTTIVETNRATTTATKTTTTTTTTREEEESVPILTVRDVLVWEYITSMVNHGAVDLGTVRTLAEARSDGKITEEGSGILLSSLSPKAFDLFLDDISSFDVQSTLVIPPYNDNSNNNNNNNQLDEIENEVDSNRDGDDDTVIDLTEAFMELSSQPGGIAGELLSAQALLEWPVLEDALKAVRTKVSWVSDEVVGTILTEALRDCEEAGVPQVIQKEVSKSRLKRKEEERERERERRGFGEKEKELKMKVEGTLDFEGLEMFLNDLATVVAEAEADLEGLQMNNGEIEYSFEYEHESDTDVNAEEEQNVEEDKLSSKTSIEMEIKSESESMSGVEVDMDLDEEQLLVNVFKGLSGGKSRLDVFDLLEWDLVSDLQCEGLLSLEKLMDLAETAVTHDNDETSSSSNGGDSHVDWDIDSRGIDLQAFDRLVDSLLALYHEL